MASPWKRSLRSAATASRTRSSTPCAAGARPAARSWAISRCIFRRRSRTRPDSCPSRCEAPRSRPRKRTLASARTCARSCRTSLELALSGRLKLDLFVTPPDLRCGTQPGRRSGAGISPTLPDPLSAAERRTRPRRARTCAANTSVLAAVIEGVAGSRSATRICAPRSRSSTRIASLLRELYAIKRETPWLLSVEDAYALVARRRPDAARGAQRAPRAPCCRCSARAPRRRARQDPRGLRGGLLRAAAARPAARRSATPATWWTTTC